MKKTFLLVCILFSSSIFATEPPACKPGQVTTPAGTKAYYCYDLTKGFFAKTWFCNKNHLWYRAGYADATLYNLFTGNKRQVIGQWYDAEKSLETMSDEELKAKWNTMFGDSVPISDPTSPDFPAYSFFLSCGQPEILPLDGLVTQPDVEGSGVIVTTVYKLRQSVNDYTWTSIGTVPVGLPCTIGIPPIYKKVGSYYLLDRNKIKLNNKFDTLPLLVYARCDY